MKYHKSIRLKNYDYKTNGYYFITICTDYHNPYLKYGKIYQIVVAELALLSKRFQGIKIDYYTLMPNHIHMILILENSKYRLDQVIQAFKSITTLKSKQALKLQIKRRLWQPNYYEHIIRDQKALYEIRKYIQENPEKDKIDFKSLTITYIKLCHNLDFNDFIYHCHCHCSGKVSA